MRGQEPTIVSTQGADFGAHEESHRSPLGRVLAEQAAIAEMAQRALEGQQLEGLLQEVCVLVGRVLDTELVDVLELSHDGSALEIVAGVGWRPGVIGRLSLPARGGSQSGYTLSTGGPVIVGDFRDEARFQISDVLAEHGARSGLSVRIGSSERPFGVVAAFSTRPNAFDHEDAAFLQSMANVLGSAVGRLRAEADLRRSRDEMAAIVGGVADGIMVQSPERGVLYVNDTAARLCGFETADQFMATPWRQMMSAFELLDPDGESMPETDLPAQVAIRTRQATEPTPIRFRIRATGEERWSMVQSVPLLNSDGRVAQVVSVFRDVTAQRRAELAHEVVADAVAVLSETLSRDEASQLLARLCVPRLADFSVVDLLEPDGSFRTTAIAHRDPDRIALGRRLRQLRPIQHDDPAGPARVIRESVSELQQVDEELLRASAQGPEEMAVLLGLEICWYVCVPLQGRGRPIGALTLVMADSGRRFDEHDLRLAEEIGSRAGVALENARLYEAAQEGRAELAAVIAAMAEAVVLFDRNGELRLSNDAADALFNGQLPGDVEQLAKVLDGTGERDLRALEGERELGSGRWVAVSVYRTHQGGELVELGPVASDEPSLEASEGERDPAGGSLVVVLRDVTEARTRQVARDAFIGVLSHELRTPITTIYGGSELLGRELDVDQRSEIVADIRAESERLARLVEDLLVMSRVERGGVEMGDDPVLIQRLLPPLIESLKMRWPELSIDLRLAEGLPAVRGDGTYLEQVLRNLLTNAIRYGDGLSHGVEVTATEGDQRVTVRVMDSGPGPGTGSPERLFELFYRAPSARRVPGGAGIGLFVCRQLVEAMGGRIWARQREGGGSEFGFELPIIDAGSVV